MERLRFMVSVGLWISGTLMGQQMLIDPIAIVGLLAMRGLGWVEFKLLPEPKDL